MSVKIEMYRLSGRTFLEEYFSKSFDMFEYCCGVCWCCIKRKRILFEFEKKEFNSFDKSVECWKIVDDLNSFDIFPVDPLDS